MSPAQTAARRRRPSAAKHSPSARHPGEEGKTSVAPFGRGLVHRPALVDRLIEARHAALAVIVAPPGYGKSSLICEWAEHDERPFFRVAFDGREAGSAELSATTVLDAFEHDGWIDPSLRSSFAKEAGAGVGEVLTSVMKSVRQPACSFVLVFEDAHLVRPAVLRQVVGTCLQELPLGSMVAVASRTEPWLPIGRLRTHRKLVEVRMCDLAMPPPEAATLLGNAGLELEFEEVRALVRRTEGWPAALYLAALSLRDGEEAGPGRTRFGGDDYLLAEYLRDDVLSAVPPDLMEFLLRTSVLEELSVPACDSVVGQSGSAVALSRLSELTELLVALDRAHQRFRWQRLFRDALRTELRRLEPELEPALQLRASTWYAHEGDIDQAIEHAVAAGDAVRAGDLIQTSILAYVAQGRNDTVQRWLGGLHPDRIADSAPLSLCAAYSAWSSGAVALAQRWALAATAALERAPRSRRDRSLATGLAALETMIARPAALQMRVDAVRAYEHEAEDSQWRPLLCMLRGVADHLTGERDAARKALQEGADVGSAAAPMVAGMCLAVEAMIAIELEDWSLATDVTDRARTLIDERDLAGDPLSALVFAASAAARAHQGRSDEAKRDLRTGVDHLAALGDFVPWYGAGARILLGHASLWLADIVGARTLLAEASRLARRMPDAVIFERWFDAAWAYMDTLAEASLSGPSALTIAELRILRFLPSHRSFREIALQLGVSANTVKTQAHAVYRKLGAASRSEAVTRASEAGLLGH